MRGWIEPLPSGRWRARVEDDTGRRHSRTFDLKRDARSWKAAQIANLNRGDWVDPKRGRQLFAAFAQEMMELRRNLRSSTRDRDESYLRNHVLPAFGSWPVARIQPSDVETWVRLLEREASLRPRTVRECHRILSSILRDAVERGLRKDNPCRSGRRAKYLPRIEHVERQYRNAEEIEALARAMDPRFSALVYVGAYLGLRWGELAGLKRDNLDMLRRQVKVVGSLERTGGGFRYVEETKTMSSRRTLPMTSFITDQVAAHLATAPDSEYVFPAPKGGFLYYQGFRRRFWNPAVERAGVGPFTPHGLRHTCAALMIAQGANPITVQRRLGHKDIAITLRFYGHLFPEQEDALTARLDQVARAAEGESSAPHLPHGAEVASVGKLKTSP